MTGEWKRPFMTGYVWQKTYGVKVGHVVKRGFGKAARWVATFDGRFLGTFEDEAEAKQRVDMVGSDWMVN